MSRVFVIVVVLGGFLNDLVGRKPVIIMASVIFAAGSIVLGFAEERSILLLGRIIVGAGIGKCAFFTLHSAVIYGYSLETL